MKCIPCRSKLFWIFLVFILTTSSRAEILSGRVYEGEYLTEPPIANGLSGVSVKLYASYSSGVLGDEVSSYTTGSDGWYGLETEQNYEFFTIVCEGKSGYTFEGSSSVDGSASGEEIEYVVPLTGKTLTGNKFWYTSETTPPANNPPVATDDSATTPKDTAIEINVLFNDSDPDGDAISIDNVSDPTHGEIPLIYSPGYGGIVYQPDPGFVGSDTFDYTISDGKGGTDTATVTVTVEQGEEPPQNNPPVADAGGPYSTQVGNPVMLDGSGSYDPDTGDSITGYQWYWFSQGNYIPINGVLTAPTIWWVPPVAGQFTLKLEVTDSHGEIDTDTSTVDVQAEEPPAGTGTLDGYKRDADTGEGLENWRIFIDLNGNGEFDSGEPSDLTDSNGYYRIDEVEPGTYRVCEELQDGWEPAGGGSACVEAVDIIAGTITTQDFHNRRTEGPEPGTGTIRGMKFNDLNSNGQRDPDEPGLSDWKITLTDNDGNVLAFTTTDQNGEYQFFNLEPGSYGVSEDDKDDWFQTFPAEKHYSGVMLSQGEVLSDMDFGNHWTGTEPPEEGNSIRGKKYNDLNGNGQKDSGEPGLADWTIFLDSNDNGSFNEGEPQTTTDVNGNYAFTNLEAGVYRIHEVNQPGWRQTDPAVDGVPGYWLIDLEEGQEVTEIDFGNSREGTSLQVDVLDLCLNVEIDIPGIGLVNTSLSGPTTIRTQVGPNGEASDQGVNGLDEVVAQLTDMNLSGVDPVVGQLRMRLNSNTASMGQIEERANNTPGLLDLPPYTPTGNADSFFDVFFQIELPDLGVVLLTNQPIRLTALITHFPPVNDYSDISKTKVELFDQNSQPTGIYFGPITSCKQEPSGGVYDFGDAPDPTYPTLLVRNGARHRIDPDVYLGSGVEADPDGQPDTGAQGDDNDGDDDEDGVVFTSPLIPGTVASVTVTASVQGLLYGWIDFQQDGQFDMPSDYVFSGQVLSPGANVLGMAIPSNAAAGTTYARFRFSRDSILDPEGEVSNGEVEDYVVEIETGQVSGTVKVIKEATPADDTPFLFCANFSPESFFNTLCEYMKDPSNNTWTFNNPNSLQQITETITAGWTLTDITITGDTDNGSIIDKSNATVDVDYDEGENIVITFKNEKTGETQYDFGDAPDSYKTLHNSGGPYHDIGQVMMGNSVDADTDGQPGPLADADNDDGVSFPLPLEVNQFATVVVNINSPLGMPAAITGWIDFDHNGTFEDPAERIAGGIYTGAGVPVSWTETFLVPATALSGPTYARFRIYRTEPGVDVFPSPTSYGGEGEVEDYLVEIEPASDQPPSGNLITGIKFNDLDGDGLWEPGDGESGLPGWTIWLDTNNDGIPDQTTQTNSQGGFDFPGVSAGTYTVGEELQPGWTQTSPPAPGTFTFTIGSGPFPTAHFMMFGNRQSDLPTGQVDFGDAPTSYGDAWHTLNDNLTLGSMIDAESMQNYSSDATGDDIHQTDDEDGIIFSSSLARGKTVEVCAEIHNNDSTSKEVIIAGWIDFDGNYQWDPIGDDIGTRNVYLPAHSIVTECWMFTVPQNANTGVTFARFRLYNSDPNPMAIPIAILPIGDGGEGEVEDYQVYILSDAPGPDEGLDYGDAPSPYPDASDMPGDVWLGQTAPDVETGTQAVPPGLGDDTNGIDDEDGVSFQTDLVPGKQASVAVEMQGFGHRAVYAGWIDFNRDGDWNDAGELIGSDEQTLQMSNIRYFVFQVPANASLGKTYARFRIGELSQGGGLFGPEYPGPAGEVEDYEVEIKLDGNTLPPGGIIHGYKFNDLNGDGFWDPNEPALPGWTIWLDTNNNSVEDAGDMYEQTDTTGHFKFTGVPAGTYTLGEQSQPGWIQTAPAGGILSVTSDPNTPSSSILFGNQQTGGPTYDGKICGSKWNDLNGNGISENTESSLAGWNIYLDMNHNGRWDTSEPAQFTDATGSFEFTGLAVGSYTIAEEMQPGWKQTWPGGAGTHIISVQSGPVQSACVMFGNQQTQAAPLLDWGDAPDPSYPTLLANNGARHIIVPGIFLGGCVDTDPEGQPAPDARGDDYDGSDDEDGVFFITPLIPAQQAEVEVLASSAGYLDAWIDFNADGNWTQTSDQIFTSEPTLAGINILLFQVPTSIAIDNDTYARFRFSSAGTLAPDGSAQDGEVEDYHILLGEDGPYIPGEGQVPHVKWSQPPIEIDPNINVPPVFCGWDEPARSIEQSGSKRQWRMDADDFRCLGPIPVTRIRWWGGYKAWTKTEPPELQPEAWHIGFWANQVEGLEPDQLYLERLVWSIEVPNERIHREPVGIEEFPEKNPEMCYFYELTLEPEEWFHQREFESNYDVLWISITAVYPADVEQVNLWGWMTRPRIWRDGAITPAILGDWPTSDERLFPGRIYPIENSLLCGQNRAYDLCFELLTEQPWVKWDQPFTGIREWQSYSDNKSSAIEQDGGELLMSRGVADDWLCERQDPVTAIVWNGSYIGYGYEACKCNDIPEPRKPDYFLLSIWDNAIGEDSELNNYPGEKIWEYVTYDYEEVLVGYDRNPDNVPNEPVFRYSVRLPEDAWFRQEAPENIYWFSVIAVYRESVEEIPYEWGWTNHSHSFGNQAMSLDYETYTIPQWEPLLETTDQPVDMSFEFFTAPDF
jgi:hypothetical protein